ncbi:type II secretion system F family protein [Cellulomonas sp. McL0617]|uniref:type II secretion system F family protein n=1 Tax=Cellulomonas sp. McL0617 TaxID=3415675 RepID=UPI003CF9C918
MNTIWLVVLAGTLIGAGLVVAIAGLTTARPDLADAVARLLPVDGVRTSAPLTPGRFGVLGQRVLPGAVDTFGLARFAADLRMVELPAEALAARKIAYALIGLVSPTTMTALLAIAGISIPVGLPLAAGVGLGVVFFWLPDVTLRKDATAARESMRQATCVFLELVAMERLADAGPTEALDRAVAVGGSPQFARIRDALLRAELAGQPSWTGLSDLAEQTGVVELGDTADIMRLAGHDGAAVYATLRARASSLRSQLLAASTAKANAASEHMVVPVAVLGLCFMALLVYPAFVRILLS